MRRFAFLPLFAAALFPAFAGEVEHRDFADGRLVILETDDGEKVLSFNGAELARGWFLAFDREVQVAGQTVLLYGAGDGGNACGPDAVIVWKPEGAPVKAERFGDCGAPAAASDGERLLFAPWPLPGETLDMTQWTPDAGFTLAGALSFRPQPETTWAGLAAKPLGHPMDFFANAELYAAAQALLGDDLSGVALALSVSSEPEKGDDGLLYARGCVPHACTVSDGFIAVDPAAKGVWLAQMQDEGAFKYWPDRSAWPAKVSAAFDKAFAE